MDTALLQSLIAKHPYKMLEKGGFITGPVRLAFANLAKPKKKDNGKLMFSVCMLVPKGSDVSVAKKCAGAFAVEKFGSQEKVRAMIEAETLIMPFKTQNKGAAKGYKGFEPGNVMFEGQRSTEAEPPKFFGGQKINGKPVEMDLSEAYSGMWALVKLRPYYWKSNGREGISFGLTAIQKLADDERLAGDNSAEGFDEIETHYSASAGKAALNGAAASMPAADFGGSDYL